MTPARLYALLFGVGLVLTGLLGFSPLLDLTAAHNLAHIATGVPGVLAFRAGNEPSRLYAVALAAVYAGLALAGMEPLLHGAIAVAGVAAWAGSAQGRPASAT